MFPRLETNTAGSMSLLRGWSQNGPPSKPLQPTSGATAFGPLHDDRERLANRVAEIGRMLNGSIEALQVDRPE
jgi:hypothetical protein